MQLSLDSLSDQLHGPPNEILITYQFTSKNLKIMGVRVTFEIRSKIDYG